jgi:hypothetical protein
MNNVQMEAKNGNEGCVREMGKVRLENMTARDQFSVHIEYY